MLSVHAHLIKRTRYTKHVGAVDNSWVVVVVLLAIVVSTEAFHFALVVIVHLDREEVVVLTVVWGFMIRSQPGTVRAIRTRLHPGVEHIQPFLDLVVREVPFARILVLRLRPGAQVAARGSWYWRLYNSKEYEVQ